MILEHIPWEWPGWRWRWWWWGSAYWCSVYGKERVEIFRDVTISFFPNFLEKLCVYFGVKCPLSMSYLKRHSLVDFCFSCKPWYNLALLFDCFPVFLKIVLIVGSNFVCLFVCFMQILSKVDSCHCSSGMEKVLGGITGQRKVGQISPNTWINFHRIALQMKRRKVNENTWKEPNKMSNIPPQVPNHFLLFVLSSSILSL